MSSERQAPAHLSSLVRAALFVENLERSVAFWQGLGLGETYYEGALHGPSVAATLSVPDGTACRCAILKRPGTANYGMLGLFELTPFAPPRHKDSLAPEPGEIALVFYADDFDGALEAARRSGARAMGEPVLFTMPHRSQREVCLRGPDFELINLIERPSHEQFRTEPVSTSLG